MNKRVVITGIGVLTPVGSGKEKFWSAISEGRIGTSRIEGFDTSMFEVHNGGEVRDVDPSSYMRLLDPLAAPRTTQLAVAAAKMAIEDAAFHSEEYLTERSGVCIGTTIGNGSIIEQDHDRRQKQGTKLPPDYIRNFPISYISAAVATELGFEGPNLTVPTACAAGNYAISWGADLIKDGMADIVLVGGSDALSRFCYTTFHRLGAIAPDRCQPFDKNRKGMMVSEGAAVLVLEEQEKASKRGARIYAEFLGYGLSCDAHHPTAPHPDGLGAILATERALSDANVKAEDVSYVSAHGTGTKANDSTESKALRKIFGELIDSIPVSSLKSMLGHTMGAASAIEAAACALSIYNSIIPPTINYEVPDEECVQNIVPNEPMFSRVEVAVSSSFAFGGNISIIVLGRIDK
ncbi:beta-ketoacyl-[acyl-carrier-protein] synthase family protein [Cohnella endophytica]|uniref:Beta-ketoacyl-[acyl-carrier-protein] synthase family protein n=1 Tax=Cohnella endophytica TaxID=2419778 RepID=A0A494XU48_9BACL|nr:beta-ketoacyl-[acyl-carrier-protein] synthase family protein [Cohnella endophytica]RKP54143.1 beta-ketoacyl-[acyl-carrier-protein] synthase family protein [Cohnella endophytica]